MLDVILASTPTYGIGFQNNLPWKNPTELQLFKEKTMNHVLIVGRKTAQSLPPLTGRTILYIGQTKLQKYTQFFQVADAVKYAQSNFPNKKIFIAGGRGLYTEAFQKMADQIDRVHLSIMDREYECDTWVDFEPRKWLIESKTKYDEFTHYVLVKSSPYGEQQYIDLLQEINEYGHVRPTRNSQTKSLFVRHLKFDLREGFPLLTSKKMFTRGVLEELIFFLRGQTDSKLLEEKNVNIWKGNTSREFLDQLGMTERPVGVMGPMYGYQWRFFNADYDESNAQPLSAGVDQLRNVIELMKTDPTSRRLLMTAYNPNQVQQGVLPPCHSIMLQFYIEGPYLDCLNYIRSSDTFLGLPFNIASTAAMMHILAKIVGKTPRHMNITLGDAHLYENHWDLVELQSSRWLYKFPTLEITRSLEDVSDIDSLTVDDFIIHDYQCHQTIKAAMVP